MNLSQVEPLAMQFEFAKSTQANA